MMEERRKNPSTGYCVWHTGIEEKLNAFKCKMDEREKQFKITIDAQREAVSMARDDMERRAIGWNELRSELKDFRDYAASKERLDELIKEWIRWRENHLEETGIWRSDITKRLTVIETRAITWTAAIGIIIVIINVAIKWWK